MAYIKTLSIAASCFLVTSAPLYAQKVTIPPIPNPATINNPLCGNNADFSEVINEVSELASDASGGSLSQSQFKQLVESTGIMRSGASNCAITCTVVDPDDSIWFFMNNEPHPWNCGQHRREIFVNYSGASAIFSKKAGSRYLMCATFKNWSHNVTFTAEIQANPSYNWPAQYCNNSSSTNTARSAPQ